MFRYGYKYREWEESVEGDEAQSKRNPRVCSTIGREQIYGVRTTLCYNLPFVYNPS